MTTLINLSNLKYEELENLEQLLMESRVHFIGITLRKLLENNLDKVMICGPVPISSWPDWRIRAEVRTGMSGHDSKPRDIEWWVNTYSTLFNEGVVSESDLDLNDYRLYDLVLIQDQRL